MKSILTDFRALTHVEIERREPLRVSLGTKYFFVTRPLGVSTYVDFWTFKETTLQALEDLARKSAEGDSKARLMLLMEVIRATHALWRITEKPWWPISRWLFRRYFFGYFLNHMDEFFDLYQKVLAHSGRLFFFTDMPAELQADTGRSVLNSDWYRSFTRGSGAAESGKTWLDVLSMRELEKEQMIAKWEAHEKAKADREMGLSE